MKFIICFFLPVLSLGVCAQRSFSDNEMDKLIEGYKDPGKIFGNFSAMATNGKIYNQDSLKHNISFINFWFEGCHPCIAEFPALNDLYARYKDSSNFQFLSFTFDRKEIAERLAEKYQIKYPIICLDDKTIRNLHFGLGYPTSIILDRKMSVRLIKLGGSLEETEIRQTVDRIYSKQILELLKQ